MTDKEIKPDAWANVSNNGQIIGTTHHYETVEITAQKHEGLNIETLFSAETIQQIIEAKRQEFNNGRFSEYPQKVLTELLEEIKEAGQQ